MGSAHGAINGQRTDAGSCNREEHRESHGHGVPACEARKGPLGVNLIREPNPALRRSPRRG
jgi:hypothetical protein